MSTDVLEQGLRALGGAATLIVLAAIFAGLWRGWRRPMGRASGPAPNMLRHPIYYLIASCLFFGPCIALWIPLPITLASLPRIVFISIGAALFFSGLALALWGRLTLGKLYNVSTSFGAQLYADHQLVTRGPFAFVRHPMYLGVLLVGLGGILLYRTWTFVLIAASFVGLVLRARREEQALAAEFGEAWQEYRRRVPGFLPRVRPRSK